MTCCSAKEKCLGASQHGKGQKIMHGLVGDRLLRQFFGSILRRPRLNPPQGLGPGQDDDEETTKGSSDPKSERTLGKPKAEKPEETSSATISSDP